MRVRRAFPGDADWIIPELVKFARFADTKRSLIPSDPSVRDSIVDALIRRHVFFVSEKDGVPTGFICGLVAPNVLNPEIAVCYETFWWVLEKWRGSRAGVVLLDAFTQWCRENVDWVWFSLQHNTPGGERALMRRGYAYQETKFLLEV